MPQGHMLQGARLIKRSMAQERALGCLESMPWVQTTMWQWRALYVKFLMRSMPQKHALGADGNVAIDSLD
eukprot:1158169-Pelagomonas_calceolata.AAC.5